MYLKSCQHQPELVRHMYLCSKTETLASVQGCQVSWFVLWHIHGRVAAGFLEGFANSAVLVPTAIHGPNQLGGLKLQLFMLCTASILHISGEFQPAQKDQKRSSPVPSSTFL